MAKRATKAPTLGQIIARAPRDRGVTVDKLQQLIEMQERAAARRVQVKYDAAMHAVQKGLSPIRAEMSNPTTSSRYASYAALDQAIRPIYSENGFSLSFDTGDGAPVGSVRVVCKVAHVSGHREYPHIDMPADGKDASGADEMTRTHATASAITYGKRYLLCMIFNIVIGNDDDGNAAGGAPGSAGGGSHFRPERRSGQPEPQMADFAPRVDIPMTSDTAKAEAIHFPTFTRPSQFIEYSDHFLQNCPLDAVGEWRKFYAAPLAAMETDANPKIVEARQVLMQIYDERITTGNQAGET